MLQLHKDASRLNEETSAPVQGPSRLCGEKFDMVTGAPWTARSKLLHGTLTRQPNRQNRPLLLEDEEDEPEMSNNSPIEHLVTAISNLLHILQRDTTHTRILNTQVSNFGGPKDKIHEFEHLLLNNLRPHENRITEEYKTYYFQRLLRHQAVVFWQALQKTPETTLKDVLDKYRQEIAKDDFKEVSKPKWDLLVYDPTKENFSDFLKTLKKTGTQALGEQAA